MTPTQQRHQRRDELALALLQEGSLSRNELAKALEEQGYPVSETGLHNAMMRMAERGLVRIVRVRIRGHFSSFRWQYALAAGAAVAAS